MKQDSSEFEINAILFWVVIYAPILALSIYFFNQNFFTWDLGGHYLAAQQFRDSIWPYFSGWDPKQLSGYPQGYFYPTLFHWCVGGLSKVFDLVLTFKTLILLSVYAFPLSILFLAKSLSFSSLQQKIAVLWATGLVFIPNGYLGGDLFGALTIGMLTQQFAMPILFFYLGFLIQTFDGNPTKWIWAGYLGGALLLCHGFVFQSAIIFSIPLFCISFLKRKKETLALTLKIIFTIFMVSSIWLIPYLYFHSFQSAKSITLAKIRFIDCDGFNNSILMNVFFLISFYSVFKSRNEERLAPRILKYIFLFFCLFFLVFGLGSELSQFSWMNNFPVRPYRLISVFYVFLSLYLGYSVDSFKFKKIFVIISVFFMCFASWPNLENIVQPKSMKIDFIDQFSHKERILATLSKSGFYKMSPHLLADVFVEKENSIANGLFLESSLSSIATQSVMKSLFKNPHIWVGVKIFPPGGSIQKQLHWLGISDIISDEAMMQKTAERIKFTHQSLIETKSEVNGEKTKLPLYSYSLKNQIAEYLEFTPKIFSSLNEKQWQNLVDQWWVSDQDIHQVWLQSEKPIPEWNPGENNPIEVNFPTQEKIEVDSKSSTERWILLKESYFPNWKAFQSGVEIPVYRASPHNMAFFGKGKIELRFIRTPLEWISILISSIAFLSLFVLLMFQFKRKFL